LKRTLPLLQLLALLPLAAATACGGGAPEIATKNKTFYDWPSGAAAGAFGSEFEQRYPPLDAAAMPPQLEYIGVTIVRGGVHLSRPFDWHIREGSNDPGRAFIQYISPRAISFAVYERSDSPRDPWRDVMARYESDCASVGAKITGKGLPIATYIGQGRVYSVERKVDSAKRAFFGYSREILLRGEHRVVLVQVVRQRGDLADIDDELMRVINTLEAL
jgi:hypothetical protein